MQILTNRFFDVHKHYRLSWVWKRVKPRYSSNMMQPEIKIKINYAHILRFKDYSSLCPSCKSHQNYTMKISLESYLYSKTPFMCKLTSNFLCLDALWPVSVQFSIREPAVICSVGWDYCTRKIRLLRTLELARRNIDKLEV